MTENTNSSSNESILYEVLEYFVKKQEPEITKFKNDSVVLPTSGTIKNALRYLNYRYSLPESISQQISYTLPWKFAIGDKGRVIAILQENVIEIRKSKDEYSSLVGKASVPKDSFPQWRKLVWSPDGTILALASSNGYISFYNSFGNNLFNISPKSVSQNPHILEAGDAIASMFFKKPRVKTDKWDYEFIRVSYSGLLKSYCISGSEYDENHEFSFGSFYRHGVNSVVYSERHNLFFVAGNNVNQSLTCIASEIGLTCWRTLNDHPYYKLSVTSQDNDIYKAGFSIWQFIPIIKNKAQPIIFKTSLSPNNQFLVCLHTDGTISIWTVPALKLHKQWKLLEQPNYDAVNPLKTIKLKKSTANISEFQPIDAGWWSDNAVIVARYSGSITVCSVDSLENLLGNSPEFLYNHPQIEELGDIRGFLCLDCEVIVTSNKRSRESSENQVSELSSDSEKDDDDSKPVTILNYTTNLVQSALYSITDIEKFQPKRKKSKVFHRTYRLLGLKSTTPEELYSRKIEIEAYEEALSLAKTYNLDPDLVYQTQWRKSEFSINDIQEHLSKVSKRSWVLNECVSRVPESLEATRELLNFGLNGANLETLVAISIDDNGKFTPSDLGDDIETEEKSSELKQIQKVNEILEKISKDHLNESQKELIKFRKKLLNHLDKLQTYQILLESPDKFDKKFYEKFRQLSPFENAIKFAKSCNYRGVEIMFTYYGSYLIPHWLTILSFFPETLNPEKYQKLLPECDFEGRLFLLYQQELRPKDWAERSMFSDITYVEDDDTTEHIYESRSSLLAYRDKEYTQDLLNKWYTDRAYEIERDCRLVDNALALVNIGKSHNINGLEKLLFELETLDDLVYKVGLEDFSLTEVEKLSDFEKINLLMKNANENNFVENIKSMLLPYSRRKKRYLQDDKPDDDLLYEYLIFLSTDDLTLPMKFFESLKISFDPEILDATKSITTLATDCIYACNDIDMYSKAKSIFDATVIHSTGSEHISQIYKDLEKELKCLQTLNKYEVKVPLHYIRSSKRNTLDAKELFIQISESFMNIYPTPTEKNWSQMLNDMLDIQEHTFTCLEIETCFEISMIARLKSKSKAAIQGCANLMEFKKTGRSHLKVPYETAIDFILQASSEYFNNSKSLTDPDMDLAKECLHLVPDDNERIKEEYDLIESLQILNEFHINILPMQVRMSHERIKLIEDCLNSRNDAYKNKQKLLNLSKYLRVENKNNRLREGKVLNLIAKKSFEMKDYNFCSLIIRQMVKMNYQAAWDIAMNIANCDEFNDLEFRTQCIWFAIHNGPSDMIETLMKRANLLKVQILNADLEKLMPFENDALSEDNKDGEAEGTNSYHTPTTESKEFVPKIVQTSTDIVKSSAQMVKQSTFDLIKNAGNIAGSKFWKSKLNFNFVESAPKEIKADQIIEKKSREPLQKFSSFYESLHENCDISSLDTQYSKYSKVDYNPQLKLCQALLRISLLSENASYGIEVSDVNHLLVQCAEHTITEDCIMGLSYLLHLDDNYFMDVVDLFENLPQLELYHQILAYFCSIKLYSKIYPESQNVFLYDPFELIQHMSRVKIAEADSDNKKLKQRINILMQALQQKPKESLAQKGKVENVEQAIKTEKRSHDSKVKKPLDYEQTHEEVAWNNWGNEWSDIPENSKREKEEKLSAPEESLSVQELKDFNADDWGNEWTDVTGNEKLEEEQQSPGFDNSLGIIEKPLDKKDWDDDWSDMHGTAKREEDQQVPAFDVKDSLGIVEKDLDTDGWGEEWPEIPENSEVEGKHIQKNPDADDWKDGWSDIPVNNEPEEAQKLPDVSESLDITEKNLDADGWDNEWSDTPVNEKREKEQRITDVSESLGITEKNSDADGWDDEWFDTPANDKHGEEQQSPDVKSSLDIVDKDLDTDNWGNEWSDLPDDTTITNAEEINTMKIANEENLINAGDTTTAEETTHAEKSTDAEETTKLSEVTQSVENEADGWDDEWPDMSLNVANNETVNTTMNNETNETNETTDRGKSPTITESHVKESTELEEVSQSAENETDGWDDEWPDMSLNVVNNETKETNETTDRGKSPAITESHVKESTELEEVSQSAENEADGWDDEWPDITSNTVNNETHETIDRGKSPTIIESNMPVEKRYEILVDEISKIQNVDDCLDVKKLLLHTPNLNNTDLDNKIDSNLIIQLITKMIEINKVNNTSDDRLLQEIKHFLQEGLVSKEVFIEYLDKKKDMLTSEQLIYLQLCSREPSLQQAAIDYIKINYKTLTLNSAIFEEIFFCNLTSSFSVSHELYYKILEEVFTNRTLPEIESNVKLLVENLVKQKNIPHAIALQNQLEGIPPALSTYENCFQLLLRK